MTCIHPAATHCNLHWWCVSSTNQAFTNMHTCKWALVLQLAPCGCSVTTKLFILLQYRQSIACGNIYMSGHFLCFAKGTAGKDICERPTDRRWSLCPTSCLPASTVFALSPQTRCRSDAELGERTVCLQCGFPTFGLHSAASEKWQEQRPSFGNPWIVCAKVCQLSLA